MSESAKALKFPTVCANSTCAQALAGPVNHCPFCGTATQRAAPVLRVVPPVPVPAPAPAQAAPASAPEPAPAPAPPAAPAPRQEQAPLPDTARPAPPKRRISRIGLALVALLGLGAYGLQQLGSKQDQQQIEQALAAGKTCLGKKDYRCAIDNADTVLSKDRNEPRAASLKQQAQAELARLQKAEDDKQARLQAEAAQKAAAERTRQARAEQEELDARRRSEEQDRLAQIQREQRAEEQRQQDLRAQEQKMAREQRAREQQLRDQQRAAQQQQQRANSGNYTAPANAFNRPNNFGSGSSTDDIIRQGQQMQQFQRQQQQQQRQFQGQGQQQQNKDVIRSIIN